MGKASRHLIAVASLSALMWIGFGCAAAYAAGGDAISEQCPAVNTFTGRADPGHWFSPIAQNADDHVPLQCNTCLDPKNSGQRACGVARLLHSDACSGDQCGDDEGAFRREADLNVILQHDLRFQNESRFTSAHGENCRFILWALEPAIGIEDTNARSARNYWRLAYLAARTRVDPPFPDHRLAIAVQPPLVRGQHQLHLHIGALGEQDRHKVASLRRDAGITQTLTIGPYEFFATYVPNASPGEPFSGGDPFDVAKRIIPGGESSMPLYGVMAVVAPGGEGIFVLAAKKFDRRALNYRQPYACGFSPPGASR